jgi:hypothetical protein
VKKRFGILIFCCLVILLLLAGCGDSHKALYGKWEAESTTDLQAQGLGSLIFDFQPEGNLQISISSITVNIGYEFVNENTIRFKGDGSIAAILSGQEVTFKITGNTLELISNEQTLNFTRVAGQ